MKKIISLLLVFAMIFAVAACGNSNTTGTAGTTDGTTAGTTPGATSGTTTGTNGTTAGTTPPPENKGFDESNIVLTFAAISDIHLESSSHHAKFEKALSTLAEYAQDKGNLLDSIVIVGDICQTKDQISTFKDIYEGSGINTKLFFTLGNHDQEQSYQGQSLSLNTFKQVLGNSYFSDNDNFVTGDRYMAIEDADGKMHHFLIVQPKSYGSASTGDKVTFYDSSVTWLDTKLAEITAADPNAYVYVFTHAMIADTCYGSDLDVSALYGNKGNGSYWYTSDLTSTLEKYPQVVTFSGHLHFPINDERSIMQDKFTSIGTGSVANLAIEGGYANANGTRPTGYTGVSSGHIVEVDANGNVRIVRLNLDTGDQFGAPWVLDAPKADKSHLTKYSAARAEANKAPVMEGTVPEVSVSLIGGNRVASLKFAAATDDHFVHHYEIKITNTTDNSVVKDVKYLTDFYLYTDLTKMAKEISFGLGAITGGKEYKAEITAVDSWGAKSATVTGTFTVSDAFETSVPTPLVDIEFNANGTATDKIGNATVALVGGANITDKSVSHGGANKIVPALNTYAAGDSGTVTLTNYSLDDMRALYNGASGFTLEAFYVNRSPSASGSGTSAVKTTQGVFCATEYGGLGLATTGGTGVPGLCLYTAKDTYKYTYASATPSTTDLVHVVTTAVLYEGKFYTAIYVNGELSGSGEFASTGFWSTDSRYAPFANQLSLGNDIGPSGFPTKDFSIVDAKIYSEALNPAQAKAAYDNAKAIFAN